MTHRGAHYVSHPDQRPLSPSASSPDPDPPLVFPHPPFSNSRPIATSTPCSSVVSHSATFARSTSATSAARIFLAFSTTAFLSSFPAPDALPAPTPFPIPGIAFALPFAHADVPIACEAGGVYGAPAATEVGGADEAVAWFDGGTGGTGWYEGS